MSQNGNLAQGVGELQSNDQKKENLGTSGDRMGNWQGAKR